MTMSLSKTRYCGGGATQSERVARPRIATVAYRLIPAANENPIIRPSVVSASTPLIYHKFSGATRATAAGSALREKSGNPLPDGRRQGVAIIDAEPGRFDRCAEPDAD